MSHQDKLHLPKDDDQVDLARGDWLAFDLRLGFEKVADVEVRRLRHLPARRPTRPQLARLACHLYEARLERNQFFDGEMFAEPAWDMLLALYYMPQRGKLLTVSTLSSVGNVPATTGLRWQKMLLEEGLIQRGPHILDGRQQLVGLTDRGRLLMEEYLAKLFLSHGGLADTD